MRYYKLYKDGKAEEITKDEIYTYCDNPQFSPYGHITIEPCDMVGAPYEDEGVALICSVDADSDERAQEDIKSIRENWGI